MVIYLAIMAPKDDIFYKASTDSDWQILKEHFEEHDFPNPMALVKAASEMHTMVALGNALANKTLK